MEQTNLFRFTKLISNSSIDADFSLLFTLLVHAHLGKNSKASFSNWLLFLLNGRGCLMFLHTLFNRSSEKDMNVLRNLIPKNYYVKNKEGQDPVIVLKTLERNVTSYLKQIGFIDYTVIRQASKFTENN